jgi:phosphatidylglycerophosphatase A
MLRLAVLLSTCFGIGYAPVAPGTLGSLPGIALTLLVRASGGPWLELSVIAVLFVAGVWAATRAERHFGSIDPGPIVLDEVVGMMVTLVAVPIGWTGAVLGFFIFRACDVVKPFPARRLEALPGGLGVMSDDLMAAVWANAAMQLIAWCCPQWL